MKGWLHNMQLKSFLSTTQTKQPVTGLACATQAPKSLGRLTGRSASAPNRVQIKYGIR